MLLTVSPASTTAVQEVAALLEAVRERLPLWPRPHPLLVQVASPSQPRWWRPAVAAVPAMARFSLVTALDTEGFSTDDQDAISSALEILAWLEANYS